VERRAVAERREAEQDDEVTERWHPLDLDVQRYVDGSDTPADLVEYLAVCVACRRLADDMRGTERAEPAEQRALDALVTAATEQAAPAAFLATLSAEPPEPVPGQVWQLWWDKLVLLGLLAEVATSAVTIWPSTLDVDLADQTSVVVDASHSPLGADLVCWPSQATVVGSFALHTCFAQLQDFDVAAVLGTWRSGSALPSGWTRGPIRDGADLCWRRSAELVDRAAVLAAASWRDPAWARPNDPDEAGSLADLLAARNLSAEWLAQTLGVSPRVAIAMYRGSRALTDEEQVRLTAALGGAAAPLQRPDQAVLHALDRPVLRGLIREVAAAEGVDEVQVRRSFVGFRAAAR
jgi:hypothetical protein